MPSPKLNTIDDYECFLHERMAGWSPPQRVALAAALAERWLPTYEAFSAAEQWGDPANLRRGLEAVWGHVRGQKLAPADLARCAQQVDDCTPHMDDFEAPEALAVCMILREALACCQSADNAAAAVRAALSGFEAAVPDWAFEPEDQPRLWKQVAARKELNQQLKLVDQIRGLTQWDERAIQTLRKELSSPESVGRVSVKPATAPAGLTNRTAFEQYRRMVEADLKSQAPLDLPGAADFTFALTRMAVWGGRYSRRRQTIDGSYGKLADTAAQQALVTRQRALDAADKPFPTGTPPCAK